MDDLAWETIEQDIAYTCEGFDIVNETVRLPDGRETEFDYLTESESVVILPFTTDGDVVVIDEWREAVERTNRGLPAGSLEDDEKPAQAAVRELREETGYRTESVTHLTTVEPSNGFSDARFHYFVAHDCEPATAQDLDSDESISVATTAFETLLAAVRDDEMEDGRSAFAILYYGLFEDES
jgi:ADP-ribose pyrophosphatase